MKRIPKYPALSQVNPDERRRMRNGEERDGTCANAAEPGAGNPAPTRVSAGFMRNPLVYYRVALMRPEARHPAGTVWEHAFAPGYRPLNSRSSRA